MTEDNENQSGDAAQQCGRSWTVSIAVPSSIVDNAQSPELRSYLVGQIARCLVIYNIDEIVVYDEHCIPGFVFEADSSIYFVFANIHYLNSQHT